MKDKAIVANIGHFDNEIDMAGLARTPGIVKTEIKGQVHEWTFPASADRPEHSVIVLSEGRLMNLGNATGHPSFVMSNSFSNQTIAQIELFTKTDDYELQVYPLPKVLDEPSRGCTWRPSGSSSPSSPRSRPNTSVSTSRARSSPTTTATDQPPGHRGSSVRPRASRYAAGSCLTQR